MTLGDNNEPRAPWPSTFPSQAIPVMSYVEAHDAKLSCPTPSPSRGSPSPHLVLPAPRSARWLCTAPACRCLWTTGLTPTCPTLTGTAPWMPRRQQICGRRTSEIAPRRPCWTTRGTCRVCACMHGGERCFEVSRLHFIYLVVYFFFVEVGRFGLAFFCLLIVFAATMRHCCRLAVCFRRNSTDESCIVPRRAAFARSDSLALGVREG